MLTIDEDLRTFLEGGRAVAVATRNADLVPSARRGWGARVSEDGRSLEIFIDKSSSEASVANLRDNGRIAVCFVDVNTLRSLQVKGRCVEVGEPAPDDWGWVDRHRAAFTEEVGTIGFPPGTIRHLWSLEVIKIRFVIDEFYDQTPGPEAGKAI